MNTESQVTPQDRFRRLVANKVEQMCSHPSGCVGGALQQLNRALEVANRSGISSVRPLNKEECESVHNRLRMLRDPSIVFDALISAGLERECLPSN